MCVRFVYVHTHTQTRTRETDTRVQTRAHAHTQHTHTHAANTHTHIHSRTGIRAHTLTNVLTPYTHTHHTRVNWFSSGLQSAFRESFGSVRGFRACFVSQLVQFGASERRFASQLVQVRGSERVSQVNWFRSGLQSAFRESIGPHTHTHTHTHTHKHTCWFLWFTGTLHRP